LNPNNVRAALMRAHWLTYGGRFDEALAALDLSIRHDAVPPVWYWEVRGTTLFHLRRYQEASDAYSRVVEPYFFVRGLRIGALANSGRLDEARREVTALARSYPGTTISRILRCEPYRNQAERNHFADGMRKAGLPE